MKYIIYSFPLFLLLSPYFISYAMEKEQPSSSFSFKQLLNPAIKPFVDYRQTAKDKEQATQELWDSVKNNNLDKVKTALENKADVHATQPLWSGNKALITPLHRAMDNNNSEIVKVLVETGADPFTHQSYIQIDYNDVFPLSLLPVADTFIKKAHRLKILELCAIGMKQNSSYAKGYKWFATHLKSLAQKYDELTDQQPREKLHIQDQIEIIKYLTAYLRLQKISNLIPTTDDIFDLALDRNNFWTMDCAITEDGFPLSKVSISGRMKMIKDLYKKNPQHPTIQLYLSLCSTTASTFKDIESTMNQYNNLSTPIDTKVQLIIDQPSLINFNEFNQTQK